MIENYPRLIRTGAAAAIGLAAVSGCGVFGQKGYYGSVNQAVVVKGNVQDGTNLYFSPTIISDHVSGDTNHCMKVSRPINIDGKHIVEPVVNDDPNGQFTGLLLSELPKDIRDECKSGSTGAVWFKTIFASYVIDKKSVIQISDINTKK